MLRRCRSVWG